MSITTGGGVTRGLAPKLNPDAIVAPSVEITRQILVIEGGQNRAVREAALGMPGAVARLQSRDSQITALRAMLP